MAKNNKNVAVRLAAFIEEHPNCKFEIDNDCWYISDEHGEQIASDSDFVFSTEWYGAGNNYGAALADAMVILLNRRGFNIEASAV